MNAKISLTHQNKRREERSRKPAKDLAGRTRIAVVIVDPDSGPLDAVAAVAEQRHPEVLKRRLFDVAQNGDVLVAVGCY